MQNAELAPGIESLEADLFSWDEIPWDELAFPSVTWALNSFREGVHPKFEIFNHVR